MVSEEQYLQLCKNYRFGPHQIEILLCFRLGAVQAILKSPLVYFIILFYFVTLANVITSIHLAPALRRTFAHSFTVSSCKDIVDEQDVLAWQIILTEQAFLN